MQQFSDQYTMFNAVAKVSATFTANVNDTLTSAAHGLAVGDRITVTNSGGALPTGLVVGVWYYVKTVADANSFTLSATSGGATLDITGAGSGTQTFYKEYMAVWDVAGYDYVVLHVDSASSAALTLRFRGSITDAAPDFSAAQTGAINWDNLNFYDMEQISTNLPAMVRGDTGLALAGTDDHRLFRVDVRGLKWFAAITQTFSAGTLTVIAKKASQGA